MFEDTNTKARDKCLEDFTPPSIYYYAMRELTTLE